MQRSHRPQALLKPLLAHSWHVLNANFGEDTMNEQSQQKNSQCLDMGLLASLRDGELTASETAQARAHLTLCPDCAADERGMTVASQEIYDLLAELGPQASEMPDTATAFASIQSKLDKDR